MRDVMIERESIQNFVYFGSERAMPPDSLSGANYYSFFLAFIALGYGLVLQGWHLLVPSIIVVMTIAYAIFAAWAKRAWEPSLKTCLLSTSIMALFSALFFLLFGLIFFVLQTFSLLNWFIFVATYGIALALVMMFTKQAIQKNDFAPNAQKIPNLAVCYAVVGSCLGGLVARLAAPIFGQEVILVVIYSVTSFLSLIFAVGFLVNVLKLQYLKEYGFPDPFCWENPSGQAVYYDDITYDPKDGGSSPP